MSQSTFRVGGGYTALLYNGKVLSFVDTIRETAPRPVAGPQAIQPLDAEYPIEIALPAALEAGSIEVQFREQWNSEVWAALGGDFKTAYDLLGVFKAQLKAGNITLTKVINSPSGKQRKILYHNCVVVNVQIDETVNIGQMTFPKTIQFMYLNRTEIF